jgi:hypothetical protein
VITPAAGIAQARPGHRDGERQADGRFCFVFAFVLTLEELVDLLGRRESLFRVFEVHRTVQRASRGVQGQVPRQESGERRVPSPVVVVVVQEGVVVVVVVGGPSGLKPLLQQAVSARAPITALPVS